MNSSFRTLIGSLDDDIRAQYEHQCIVLNERDADGDDYRLALEAASDAQKRREAVTLTLPPLPPQPSLSLSFQSSTAKKKQVCRAGECGGYTEHHLLADICPEEPEDFFSPPENPVVMSRRYLWPIAA